MSQPLQMLQRVSYDDLYRRWEKGNWSATEIDFSEDRRQWNEEFGDLERRAALWNYAMFFHGEDSVADNLSPFIDAAPRTASAGGGAPPPPPPAPARPRPTTTRPPPPPPGHPPPATPSSSVASC